MRRHIAVAGIILSVVLALINLNVTFGQDIRTRDPAAIVDIEFSPDGASVARVFANGSIQVVNVDSGEVIFEHSASLILYRAQIDWSPDGRFLAAGTGLQIYVWNTANWTVLHTLDAIGRDEVAGMDGYSIRESWFSLEWSPDGSMLFGLTESAYLFLWETDAYTLLYNQNVGNNPTAMTWLPDGSAITNGQSIFDVATLQMNYGVRYLQFGNPSVGIPTAIGFSPNGQLLAIGDNYGSAFLLDADTYELIVSVANPEPLDQRTPIYSLGWAADSSQIMFTGWNSVYTLAPSGRLERLADAEGNLYAGDWRVAGSIAAGGVSSEGYGLFGMTGPVTEISVQSAGDRVLAFERVDPP